jgi:hypothetical protein
MKHLFTLALVVIANALFAQIETDGIDSTVVDTTYSYGPPPPERLHRFFLAADVGRGVSYHSILGEHYQELEDCRNEHENNIYVPTASLNLGYHLKRWWDVSVGLQYFQTGFDFSEQKSLSDTLPYEFSIGCDVYQAVHPSMGFVWAAFYDPRFVSGISGYHPTSATLKIRERYHYVGIPVKTELNIFVRHTIGRGLARLFVNAGVTPNYMVKQLYDMSFSNETWSYTVQDSVGIPAPFVRRWNLSSSFGGGITLMVRDHFEFRLEGNVQHQLIYFFNWRLGGNFDYQEKHSVNSTKISVRYYFRN